MTLQQIYYIMQVARVGSMNKAAEGLFISQPALTSAIKDVEEELGITIFRRTNRGVILTDAGSNFLSQAGRLYQEYEVLMDIYKSGSYDRQKFGVSLQHYSFAVQAFIRTVKRFDTTRYDFAIRETRTQEILQDVRTGRSDIGILYRSNFNSKIIRKLIADGNLEFTPLVQCKPYVYLWSGHPLAKKDSIRFEELREYPVLSFEQGDSETIYLSEELLPEREYLRRITVNDRATMFNLMIGLSGYTLCSGIINEELNGTEFIVVPLDDEEAGLMEIGYVTRRGAAMNAVGTAFLEELRHEIDRRNELPNNYEAGYYI